MKQIDNNLFNKLLEKQDCSYQCETVNDPPAF